jgi:hypothetical protein
MIRRDASCQARGLSRVAYAVTFITLKNEAIVFCEMLTNLLPVRTPSRTVGPEFSSVLYPSLPFSLFFFVHFILFVFRVRRSRHVPACPCVKSGRLAVEQTDENS